MYIIYSIPTCFLRCFHNFVFSASMRAQNTNLRLNFSHRIFPISGSKPMTTMLPSPWSWSFSPHMSLFFLLLCIPMTDCFLPITKQPWNSIRFFLYFYYLPFLDQLSRPIVHWKKFFFPKIKVFINVFSPYTTFIPGCFTILLSFFLVVWFLAERLKVNTTVTYVDNMFSFLVFEKQRISCFVSYWPSVSIFEELRKKEDRERVISLFSRENFLVFLFCATAANAQWARRRQFFGVEPRGSRRRKRRRPRKESWASNCLLPLWSIAAACPRIYTYAKNAAEGLRQRTRSTQTHRRRGDGEYRLIENVSFSFFLFHDNGGMWKLLLLSYGHASLTTVI